MIERKPVAFGDLRGWIKALEAAGEIKEINAEVDWNIEIGTVMRLAQGTGNGPALMFNNIKDYGANARCRRIFGCGLASYRRVAMMMGVDADTHPRDLVKLGRNVLSNGIAPKIVSTGPVGTIFGAMPLLSTLRPSLTSSRGWVSASTPIIMATRR